MPNPTQRRRLFSSPAWQPRDLPGLRLDLQTPHIWGLAADDPVSTWLDRSGYDNHATQSGGNRPIFKPGIFGQWPGLQFTIASSQYLNVPGLLPLFTGTDTPHSFFLVVKNAAAVAGTFIGCGRSDSSSFGFQLFGTNSAPAYRAIRIDDAGVSTGNQVAGTPDTNAHVISILYSGTTLTYRVDGVPVLDEVAFNVGAMALVDQVAIGALPRDVVSGFFGGYVGAVLASNLFIPIAHAVRAERFLGRTFSVAVA